MTRGWEVGDPRRTASVGGDFALASAGHWYGQGIAVTEQGGPYSDQPWPLDSGHVSDHQPMFFDYPGDAASYTIDDEWLFGDSLLAAPVLADVSSRRIHLPPGRWYDVKRDKVVSDDIAAYPVTLADVPMFVRLGTPDTARLEDALRRWSR